MKNNTLFIALFFTGIQITTAQIRGIHPDELAFRVVGTNFKYYLSGDLNSEDYTTGGEVVYVKHLRPHWNLAVPFKFAKALLPLDDRGRNLNQEMISSLDFMAQWKPLGSQGVFYPYLTGGAGLMLVYEDRPELNLEAPFGFGINLQISYGLYLSFETQYRFDATENRNQVQHGIGLWLIFDE